MRFTPENDIGLLHDILRISAAATERQGIGIESALMTGQKLNEF